MKNVFRAMALTGAVATVSGCMGNTNAPYTKQQGALGGTIIGAVIAEGVKSNPYVGAGVGLVLGNATGNPCERTVIDDQNTPGKDIDIVSCKGAAVGYDFNSVGGSSTSSFSKVQQTPQRTIGRASRIVGPRGGFGG